MLSIKNTLLKRRSRGISCEKEDEVKEDLVRILSQVNDSDTVKLLREEIERHFKTDTPLLVSGKNAGATQNELEFNSKWC